jgi:PAS domain S-box-containing protein
MGYLPASYDYRLVAISVGIAIAASYVALDVVGRVTANRGLSRLVWLMVGATAMGSGIWAMHFMGMLAYRLPIPVYYHVPTVAVSFLAAVLASLIALTVASRQRMTMFHVTAGSVAMGAGIASMHYIGMAAMRMAAMHHYQPSILIASVLLGVVISFVGLLLIANFRDERKGWLPKFAIATVMGLAIPAMHYTGMAAVSFMPSQEVPNLADSTDISILATAAIIGLILLIVVAALVASLLDRRLSAQSSRLYIERNMLRALIDNMPDYMFVKDHESRFVVANPHLARAVGVERADDLLGKSDFDFYPTEIANALYDGEQRVIRSGQPLFNHEVRSVESTGNEVDILTTIVPIRDAKSNVIGIAGVGRDISARKKMEAVIREAEQKYRGIFDDAIVGVYQTVPDGRFLSANSAMALILGYDSPEEMIASIADISRQLYVDSKDRHEIKRQMENGGSVRSFECQVFRKDGSKIWLAISARAIRQHGEIVRYEGMCEDVTERKQLRAQLLQAQKLESVGQLAAGIAHEINTPTQFIGDNLDFLKSAFHDLSSVMVRYEQLLHDAEEGAMRSEMVAEAREVLKRADPEYLLNEAPRAIDQALDGVRRVATLVSAMKEFSHPDSKEKVPLNLNRAVESTITVARNEWKYVAELETEFDGSIPPIHCHAGEFNQVILNLIVNAAHSIGDVIESGGPAKGKIKVQTFNCSQWAEIRISDSGTGIPESIQSRIFDPFFTTKEIGKGTGQGLAISRSIIVDKHNGSIHFETEAGKGTTFVIRLPYDGKALTQTVEVA